MRFTIYDVYDNSVGGCEFASIWDNDYRFNNALKSIGQVKCLDFENTCTTCITGTNLGWFCIWDIKERTLLRMFKASNPDRASEVHTCNLIRSASNNQLAFTYSVMSKDIVMHTIKI